VVGQSKEDICDCDCKSLTEVTVHGNQIFGQNRLKSHKMATTSGVCDIGISMQCLVLRQGFSYPRIHLWHSRIIQGTKGRYHGNWLGD